MKKILFLYSVIFAFTCLAKDLTSIKSIVNLAGSKMIICSKLKCASICPNSTKEFSSSFIIPYISIKRHLKEFVRDIPFVPSNALKLSFHSGAFCIWRNESGVVYAPDPSNPEAVIAWKLKILLDKKNNKNVNLSNLALEIDKNGNLAMKQRLDSSKRTKCVKDLKPS